MKKDFSRFKVLGITLLVTMSSCVGGSLELNAETLRSYGFEFDISSTDKTFSVGKHKKTRYSSNSKLRINHIIESGRTHIAVSGITVDYCPIVFHVRFQHYLTPLINKSIIAGKLSYSTSFHGINFQNRAGPLSGPFYN
ncbi:hypothetical protein [Saccharicrinis sp. 156]|uniref:hypothetical protein n=1 Tax=Saccharicrinis sp. 156 TaxID=3417574 RepID=UPI003D33D4F9